MFRELQRALAGLGENLSKELGCVRRKLEEISRQLGMEYGHPSSRTPPYNPERQPFTMFTTLAQPIEIDLQRELQGGLAVRGTIINQGDAAIEVITEGLDGSRTNPIVIAPKSVLDLTWVIARLIVQPRDPAQPSDVQIIMQGGGA